MITMPVFIFKGHAFLDAIRDYTAVRRSQLVLGINVPDVDLAARHNVGLVFQIPVGCLRLIGGEDAEHTVRKQVHSASVRWTCPLAASDGVAIDDNHIG